MSESPADATTLPELVRCAAACYGARIAITDGDVSLSFVDLEAARRKSAAAFIAAGLVAGDRVAIWAPNIYQWIIAAVGAQSVGGVLVPLNTRLKGPEAAYILRTSGARFLFTVSDFLDVSYPSLLRDQDCGVLEKTLPLLKAHIRVTDDVGANTEEPRQQDNAANPLHQPIIEARTTKTCNCSYHIHNPAMSISTTEIATVTRAPSTPPSRVSPIPASATRCFTPAAAW